MLHTACCMSRSLEAEAKCACERVCIGCVPGLELVRMSEYSSRQK